MSSPGRMLTEAVALLNEVKNASNGECVTVFGKDKYIFSSYAEIVDFTMEAKNDFRYKIREANSIEEILDICTAFERDGEFVYQVFGNPNIAPDINPGLRKTILAVYESEPIEVSRKDGTAWRVSCKTRERKSERSNYVEKILKVRKL